MSKSKRELTAEEQRLWRAVTSGARAKRLRIELPREQPATQHRSALAPIAQAPSAPDRGAEKRIRRGRVEIEATLDLHGHTQATGRAAVARFLQEARARDYGAVIVVTGIGSGGAGVLRRQLPEWLNEPETRPLIAGYARAHRRHGGAGALYVFLKRGPRAR